MTDAVAGPRREGELRGVSREARQGPARGGAEHGPRVLQGRHEKLDELRQERREAGVASLGHGADR